MFSFFKKSFNRIYTSVTDKLSGLFTRTTIDSDTERELERILLEADTGVAMTKLIMERLRKEVARGSVTTGADIKKLLHTVLYEYASHEHAAHEQVLPEHAMHDYAHIQHKDTPHNRATHEHALHEDATHKHVAHEQALSGHTPHKQNQAVRSAPNNAKIYLLVGINGSGKTTCVAKLAHLFKNQGKKVLLVAADTFRAAAPEQLAAWATATNATLVIGTPGQEPASVVFAGCEVFAEGEHDIMIIDTAGRLQTKTNLMRELEKMRRIIEKKAPNASVCTLLTIDAMLGQNSLEQARVFHESTPLDGIILTKMDGTGKGGIVFAIMHELKIPIVFMTYGEKLEDMAQFNLTDYITSLLNN
jgi:fused signal recognition particle receptor